MADTFSSLERKVKFCCKYRNALELKNMEESCVLAKFPVFWQNLQIPCVFRDFSPCFLCVMGTLSYYMHYHKVGASRPHGSVSEQIRRSLRAAH